MITNNKNEKYKKTWVKFFEAMAPYLLLPVLIFYAFVIIMIVISNKGKSSDASQNLAP